MKGKIKVKGRGKEDMGMEIKVEIKPEGWGEDNYSELVKKCPDQWVERGDYVEKYLSSFNTSSVEETTSLARDALTSLSSSAAISDILDIRSFNFSGTLTTTSPISTTYNNVNHAHINKLFCKQSRALPASPQAMKGLTLLKNTSFFDQTFFKPFRKVFTENASQKESLMLEERIK